jgi:hypothetical protein
MRVFSFFKTLYFVPFRAITTEAQYLNVIECVRSSFTEWYDMIDGEFTF